MGGIIHLFQRVRNIFAAEHFGWIDNQDSAFLIVKRAESLEDAKIQRSVEMFEAGSRKMAAQLFHIL
jgi:hypothetical protein